MKAVSMCITVLIILFTIMAAFIGNLITGI